MDFDTLIPQGYCTVGKIPLGSLLLEPVAPKQETFNLVRHRYIGFEVVTVNDKRQSSVTKNVKASPVGCEKRKLRRGQVRIWRQVGRDDRPLATAVYETFHGLPIDFSCDIDLCRRHVRTDSQDRLDLGLLLGLAFTLRAVLTPMA